jgi:alpha-ketoglutarate-dependent 2,4-dichlorophenoxyacetate dioxygenase
MSISVQPVNSDFVATVNGVDLRAPVDEAAIRLIEQAICKYGVLVFPHQALDEGQQVAFGSALGPLDTALKRNVSTQVLGRHTHEAIIDISNVDAAGRVAARDSEKILLNVVNRVWHSDGLGRHWPFRYSILAAVSIVSWGGDTQFADLRAAYDTLDLRTQQLLDVFSFLHPKRMFGIASSEAEERAYPPVCWPLVRTHPDSGRKVLWVDSKLCEIRGVGLAEGRALAQELLEHATQRERVYSHSWRITDLVMWDNRSVLHRGRRFDLAERRDMRRVSTLDDVPSLGHLNAGQDTHIATAL